MSRPRICVLTMGGTIAMADDDARGAVPALLADALVASVPALAEVADIAAVSVRQEPGANLTQDDVVALARQVNETLEAGAVGAVVTQGTDTLEESAFLLDLLLDRDEPVVVTGAMRNPGMAGADGPSNLLAAVQTASDGRRAGKMGVLVVMNDQIHHARFVRKVHTSSPGAFASATGPIGWVSEGAPRVVLRPPKLAALSLPDGSGEAPVALVRLGLGDDGRLVGAVRDLGYQGVVIEALGGGHVPAGIVETLGRLSATMPVVLASRTGAGEMLHRTYGFPGSETDLLDRGLIPSGYLDGLKARILLSVLLRCGATGDELRKQFTERSTSECFS